MKIRPYVSSGWAIRFLYTLIFVDIVTLLGAFYIAWFPIVFALFMEFTIVMALLMAFYGPPKRYDSAIRSVSVNDQGFLVNHYERLKWDQVSSVTLNVVRARITTGARYKTFELDPRVAAKMRPMSGAGYVPELTRTINYGILTVYTAFSDRPAIQFKCRTPVFRPERIMSRMKRIGTRSGSPAAFNCHINRKKGSSSSATV